MTMILNFYKNYKYLFLIILISLIVYFRWLSFSIFVGGDWGFYFKEMLVGFSDFNVWNNFYNFGEINLLLWRLVGPNNLLFGLFGFLGLDSNITDKILIIWPWIILSGISSFFLVRKITKSEVGGFVGSLVFSYNTYFLAINSQGHFLLSSASIFAVLSLLFFIKSFEEKKMYLSILTAIFLFITGVNDLRVLYVIILVMFFYFLYFMIVIENKIFTEYKRILKNVLIAILPIIIIFLLNIFWIMASFLTGSLTENDVLARTLFGNSFLNITNAITLFHPFWTGEVTDWFVVQKIPFYFWLIPLFAFSGLILNRKNKNIVFFGFISLLGIFLSKQVGEPFPDIYPWLFKNLLGFNAFREASKFFLITVIGYSVLIGAFVGWLWRNLNKNQWQNIVKHVLTLLIAGLFLWNTKPIITGELSSLFIPSVIPQDYLILKDFILEQPDYFKTYWVPTSPPWIISQNEKPVIGMDDFDVIKYDDTLPIPYKVMSIFKENFSNQLFDLCSVKYVVVPSQNKDRNDVDVFVNYGGDMYPYIRQWYIYQLDQIGWLKKLDIGVKNLVVYKNENFKDHIYITKELESIYKNLGVEKVDYQFINPTEYKISLKNIKQIFYLNFSEMHHPDWNLRLAKFNWFSGLINKNYFLDNKYHVKNDAGFNSFLINPEYIKQNFPKEYYKENLDGSIDIEMTLYFKPQSYFYLGLIISGVTLLGCLSYLGFDFINRRKKKNKEIETVYENGNKK